MRIKFLALLLTALAVAGCIFSHNALETVPEFVKLPPMVEEAAPEAIEAQQYRYIQGCPLSKELQQEIFDICEKYNVSFEFVMAVINRESRFDINAEGDGCESVGLMQVQEKWHSELMEELGVSDLYDPVQNVEVGVALLASYFEKHEDVYFVLMKYNGGAKYAYRMTEAGKVSDYALEITETAIMYERQNGI